MLLLLVDFGYCCLFFSGEISPLTLRNDVNPVVRCFSPCYLDDVPVPVQSTRWRRWRRKIVLICVCLCVRACSVVLFRLCWRCYAMGIEDQRTGKPRRRHREEKTIARGESGAVDCFHEYTKRKKETEWKRSHTTKIEYECRTREGFLCERKEEDEQSDAKKPPAAKCGMRCFLIRASPFVVFWGILFCACCSSPWNTFSMCTRIEAMVPDTRVYWPRA